MIQIKDRLELRYDALGEHHNYWLEAKAKHEWFFEDRRHVDPWFLSLLRRRAIRVELEEMKMWGINSYE